MNPTLTILSISYLILGCSSKLHLLGGYLYSLNPSLVGNLYLTNFLDKPGTSQLYQAKQSIYCLLTLINQTLTFMANKPLTLIILDSPSIPNSTLTNGS